MDEDYLWKLKMISIYTLFENIITFPKNEWIDIKKRLNDNNTVSTIRIHKEFGKYKKGTVYKTEWGDTIKILDVKKINNIKQYEFYKDLTQDMLNQIGNVNKLEVIKLRKIT